MLNTEYELCMPLGVLKFYPCKHAESCLCPQDRFFDILFSLAILFSSFHIRFRELLSISFFTWNKCRFTFLLKSWTTILWKFCCCCCCLCFVLLSKTAKQQNRHHNIQNNSINFTWWIFKYDYDNGWIHRSTWMVRSANNLLWFSNCRDSWS